MRYDQGKGKRFKKRLLEKSTGAVIILLVAIIMSMLMIAVQSISAAAPVIANFSNPVYVERTSAIPIAPSVTISGDNDYSDSWIEYELTGGSSTETLGLITTGSASEVNGIVSIVGTDVYIGDGTTARLIGLVDANFNGANGKKLRINFSSPLQNAQFTEPVIGSTIPGWTVNNSQIYPSTTAAHQALFPRTQGNALIKSGTYAPYTMTRSGHYSYQTDVNYYGTAQLAEGQSQRGLISSPTFQTSIVNDAAATGGKALRLYSYGRLITANPNPLRYGSAFGPEVYSEPFTASAGDQLALNWRASGSGDNYEVYGYLLNTQTDARTLLFYGRGGSQGWTTATGTIPDDGTYKFHFINGSFDRTGGYVLGAEFFIDNIRVLSSVSASDAVVQAITRSVTYHNSSCTPPASRTITARVRTSTGTTGSASAAIQITPVNCPPNLTAAARNPAFKLGSSPAALFTSTSVSDPEANLFVALRFTASGMVDGTNEKLIFDGTEITLSDGQAGTTSSGYSYSVSGSAPVMVSVSSSGASAAALQTAVNNMAYTNAASPPTPGERAITLAYLSDNGGTANGGVDSVILNIPSIVSVIKADQSINFAALPNGTYGDAAFNLNASATSDLSVHYTSSNPDAATISGNTVTIVGAGSTTITASQGGSTYYNAASSVSRTLTVVKKELIVTAANRSKAYGYTLSLGSEQFTVSGLASGDSIASVSMTSAGTASAADAGDYAITITGVSAASGTELNNYTIRSVPGTLTINQRAITVSADDTNKVYGYVDPSLTYKIDSGSLVDGDSFSGSLVRAAGEDVDSYAIGQGTLTLGDNYTISFTGGTLTINQRAISVAADSQSKTYGENDPDLTFEITAGSLMDGDSFEGSLSRTAGEDADDYAISQGTLTLGDNYAIDFTGSTLTINQRAISVAADSQSKTYGEDDPTLTYAITAGKLMDGDSFKGSLVRAPGEDADDYAIGQGTLTLGDNYTIDFTGSTLTVNARPLTIKAVDKTKVYGDSDPVFEVQYINLASSDTSDMISGLKISREPGSAAGRYTITLENAENGNYVITYVSGKLTIEPKQITITADAQSRKYGQQDPQLTYMIAAGALEAGDTLSGRIIREPGENVGVYMIMQGTLEAGENYLIDFNEAAFVITEYNQDQPRGSVTNGHDDEDGNTKSFVAEPESGYGFAYWSDGTTLYSTSQILVDPDLEINSYQPVFWPQGPATDQKTVQLNVDGKTIVSFHDDIVRMVLPAHSDPEAVLSVTACEQASVYGTPENMYEVPLYYCLQRSENLNDTVIRLEISLDQAGIDLKHVDLSKLQLYRWNDEEELWEQAGIIAQGVDEEAGIIWADVDNFSTFGVFYPADAVEIPKTGEKYAPLALLAVLMSLGGLAAYKKKLKRRQEEA